MSIPEEVVVKFPIRTKLICSDCGAPGEGSCRCGAAYVTPGDRAEAAVKANPEMSDRAIAEEIGVASNTVRTARKRTAQGCAVETRTGKDGKTRKPPKPRKAPKRHDKADTIAALADAGTTTGEIAELTKQHETRYTSGLLRCHRTGATWPGADTRMPYVRRAQRC